MKNSKKQVFPEYDGRSIVNIPATICKLFQIPGMDSKSLQDLDSKLEPGKYKNIILLLVDALGFPMFTRWMESNQIPFWAHAADEGSLKMITSTAPCTTSTAMTSLWTGKPAGLHGINAYEVWLKEYGMVVNMILQSPMSYHGRAGDLKYSGFDPETFVQLPKLGTHLSNHGITPYSFSHVSISKSGLSKTYLQDTKSIPYYSISEAWINLRELIQSSSDEQKYIWFYYSEVDGLSHRYGPQNERVLSEFQSFTSQLQNNLLNGLSEKDREETLLILTADHGQVFTPKKEEFNLNNHPEFMDKLQIKPTGEHRAAYLHIKPGSKKWLEEYILKTWPGHFTIQSSDDAIQSGLYGDSNLSNNIRSRFGDLIVYANDQAYLWWDNAENPLLGRHGAFDPEEMQVPLLTTSLKIGK